MQRMPQINMPCGSVRILVNCGDQQHHPFYKLFTVRLYHYITTKITIAVNNWLAVPQGVTWYLMSLM